MMDDRTHIHPLAFVDPKATLGRDVRIGPFCHVGPEVTIGDNCELISHVTLLGPSVFGAENKFYPNCVLGAAPQDLKYKGGPTRLEVGRGNVFRECVTVHRGTEVDFRSGGVTRVGNNNLIMVGVHLAHDVQLGDNVIIANTVQVAGHVSIEDRAVLSGGTVVAHFSTVGRYSFAAGMTRISSDVPPYMKVSGYELSVRALNTQHLQRWGFSENSLSSLKQAHRLLFARGDRSAGRILEAMRTIEGNGLMLDEHVSYLIGFLQRSHAGRFGRAREATRGDSDEDRARYFTTREVEPEAD
jgi:UDP-N-acetylglucosamine acyltransferase